MGAEAALVAHRQQFRQRFIPDVPCCAAVDAVNHEIRASELVELHNVGIIHQRSLPPTLELSRNNTFLDLNSYTSADSNVVSRSRAQMRPARREASTVSQ